MEQFLTALWTVLDALSIFIFLEASLGCRVSAKTVWLSRLCCCILVVILNLTELPAPIRTPLTALAVILFSTKLYNGKIFSHLLVMVLAFCLFYAVDAMTMYLAATGMQLSYDQLIWRPMTYTLVATTGKLVSLWLSWLLKSFRRPISADVPKTWVLLMILFPLVSLLMIIVVMEAYRSQLDMSLSALIFFFVLSLSNFGLMYLLALMQKTAKEKQAHSLLRQQMQLQAEGITALEKAYRTQRAITHEFQHHLDTISDLLKLGKANDVQDYVAKLQSQHRQALFAVRTNHSVIDVILNQKYQICLGKRIDMQIMTNDLSSVTLPTEVIVILLSNILDNAIEACGIVSASPTILCKLQCDDTLYISVRNTSQPVVIQNEHILSTKANAIDHGYGLSNMKRVLDEIGAEYSFNYANGWFEFAAEVPLTSGMPC